MSSNAAPPTRSPTGGEAPRRVLHRTVVERAPSHDGAPTFAAYWALPEGEERPQYAHRIYDTTPQAADPDRVAALARAIHEGTWDFRCTVGRAAPDRIEVVGLPMVAGDAMVVVTDEARAARCRDHQVAELASEQRRRGGSRTGGGGGGWWLPGTMREDAYRREILVVDRLGAAAGGGVLDGGLGAALVRRKEDLGGNGIFHFVGLGRERPDERAADAEGSFLTVGWDLGPEANEGLEEDEVPMPELYVRGHAIARMDQSLSQLRERIERFYLSLSASEGEGGTESQAGGVQEI